VQEELEARNLKKEAVEAAKREQGEAKAEASGRPEENVAEEEDHARMTKEQLSELAEALSILTAKSSIVKERDELKSLLEDNLLSEAVRRASSRNRMRGCELG
jgi:LETM1 and EF-hand domain-containing protein 1